MSSVALVLALPLGEHAAADVLLVAFVIAAVLESGFAVCVGCKLYMPLERAGVMPACKSCADVGFRP